MPTTQFDVLATGDDGYVSKRDPVYPPDAASASVDTTFTRFAISKELIAANDYRVGVALMRWDTSSLPDDATVTAATLRLLGATANTSPDARDLTAEWYEPGTIDAADYTSTVGIDAHAGTLQSSISIVADTDFILINVSNVSLTGYTGIRLHISGGVPTGLNVLEIAAFDHATLDPPRLIVEYVPYAAADYSKFPKKKLQYP